MSTTVPARRIRTPVVVGAVALAAAGFAAAELVRRTGGVPINWMADFDVYRGGGGAVLHGPPLYDLRVPIDYRVDGVQVRLPFTYTPFAALVFVPLSLPGTGFAHAFWFVLNTLALAAVVWTSLGLMRVPAGRLRAGLTVAGTAAAFLLDPVLENAFDGQINVLLMLLVLVDRAPWVQPRWRGVLTGVAAAIKLTPLVFAVHLLFAGRPKDALRAFATFAAGLGLSFLVLPDSTRRYWLDGWLFDIDRFLVGPPIGVNHSLAGFFARLAGQWQNPGWTVPVCGLAGLAGVLAGAWLTRRGHELLGVTVVGATAVAVAPLTWYFHLVWIVPALVWLGCATWQRSGPWPAVVGLALFVWFEVPVYGLAQRFDGSAPYQFTTAGNLIATLAGPLVPIVLVLGTLPWWARNLRPPGG